jgi:hypothetical protein
LLIRWLGCKIIISIISHCIGAPASYAKLIKWWAENKKTQQYILGTEATRLILTLIKNGSTKNEIPNQIDLTLHPNINGNAFLVQNGL